MTRDPIAASRLPFSGDDRYRYYQRIPNEQEMAVVQSGMRWTNQSVVRLAGNQDPIELIETKARNLVLSARDSGWQGPPFNPLAIAKLLNIPAEANADVIDARTVQDDRGLRIQFNPTQPRERLRFSIAHEIAHTLFPDVGEQPRHRGGSRDIPDDWQLEMLCNLAAAEFVMPTGSLPPSDRLPPIEELIREARRFDVSVEAFLIRVTKVTNEPVVMFCASPIPTENEHTKYRIDYTVPSSIAPTVYMAGRMVPEASAVYGCTAIGYSDHATESWFGFEELSVECVGIPRYPGAQFPRVAGLVRFRPDVATRQAMRIILGNALEPRAQGNKIICQLVNDQARTWGGGVARSTAKKYPKAQASFSLWVTSIPRSERLGSVHFERISQSTTIASLVGQQGYGPSNMPRIRYVALASCLEKVRGYALEHNSSVHMPRIGEGQSGGSWETVAEIVRTVLVNNGIAVTVYELPPRRVAGELFV
jgi:Zn-dependent peptidase ImmA (M78 family)/O-acetyl-ADP-ribose deacetylase (regulator of RNase III)